MRNTRLASGLVLLAVATLLGLGKEEAGGQTGPLPPGHPPLGGQGGGHPTIPAPPSDAGRQELTWKVPAGWTQEQPSSSMRRAQYRIAGAGGAAECAVFYFGSGQGGDADSNAKRWASQFKGAGGNASAEAKRTSIKVGDMSVLMVEVSGTYVGGMGGMADGPAKANYMLLGAIAEGPDANWFFRLLGPRATVEAQRAAFDEMIRSLKRGKSV